MGSKAGTNTRGRKATRSNPRGCYSAKAVRAKQATAQRAASRTSKEPATAKR